MCEEVETLKAEREVMENEIKEAKFDMGMCRCESIVICMLSLFCMFILPLLYFLL